MADNLAVKDGLGGSKSLATKEVSTDVHIPKHMLVNAGGSEVDLNTYLTALNGYAAAISASTDGLEGQTGIVTETAPASDTASSGLNGRLQRVAQRITSLIALLPSSLGQKAKTGSLAVTLASDEDLLAYAGGVTETAPASDTASSGLNGRLQRIAQRLTSMIALLPAALGQGTMAQSMRVVLASDQSAIQTSPGASAASGGITSTYMIASSAASTNAANIKASSGRVYAIQGLNKATYDVFLCLYDTAASPTAGTTTLRKKIPLAALQPFALDFPVGCYFGSGIAIALTKLGADADATAVASGDIVRLNVDYV